MSNDKLPDEFGFPEDDNGDSGDNEPQNDDSQDSNGNGNQNESDGSYPMNDVPGLPENWKPKDIPTEIDLTYVGEWKLKRRQEDLNRAKKPADIAAALEAIKEALQQTHTLPRLVPLIVETGLAIRSPAQKIGRLDLWEDVVYLLFHTIHDQVKSIEERSEYFKYIFASLSDVKASTGSKFPTESALRELASDYGMDDSDDAGWLPARAAFVNAVILDYSLERAVEIASELMQLARNNHDLMTEMRVYLSLSRLYINENDYHTAFTFVQQALVVAIRMNAERFYSDIISNMISCALALYETPYVETLFVYWKQLRPHLEDNVHENVLYQSLSGKFNFDRMKNYDAAAQAFEKAYKCEVIQQKAIGQATQLLGWGMAMTKAGEYETAHELYQQALNIHRREGNGETEIWIRHAMGWNAKEGGNIEMGIVHLENALERALDLPLTAKLENICEGIKEDLLKYRSSLKK